MVVQFIVDIDMVGFENQDLIEIEDCLDCLYVYVLLLDDSEYEDFFMKERVEWVLSIYCGFVKQEYLIVVVLIVFYYEFQEEVELDSVIIWWEKVICWGNVEDNYELVDFILDYCLDFKVSVVVVLEVLFNYWGYVGWVVLKLFRFYMWDEGEFKNLVKGI